MTINQTRAVVLKKITERRARRKRDYLKRFSRYGFRYVSEEDILAIARQMGDKGMDFL